MTAFFFLIEVFIGYFTALCFYAVNRFSRFAQLCMQDKRSMCPVTCLASSTFGACPIAYLHGNYFLIMCIYENQGPACFSHSLGYIQSHISRECVFIEQSTQKYKS